MGQKPGSARTSGAWGTGSLRSTAGAVTTATAKALQAHLQSGALSFRLLCSFSHMTGRPNLQLLCILCRVDAVSVLCSVYAAELTLVPALLLA